MNESGDYTGTRTRLPNKAASVKRQIALAHELARMTPQQKPNRSERNAPVTLPALLEINDKKGMG